MGGTNDGFFGQKELATGNSEFNQLEFVVRMLTGKFNIATLAQVVAVNPAPNNTSQAVGTVDVLPMGAAPSGLRPRSSTFPTSAFSRALRPSWWTLWLVT